MKCRADSESLCEYVSGVVIKMESVACVEWCTYVREVESVSVRGETHTSTSLTESERQSPNERVLEKERERD